MRSLHLTFQTKSKASTLQTIWEAWFTLSVITFILSIAVQASIGIVILLAFHVVMSTLVGITTSED